MMFQRYVIYSFWVLWLLQRKTIMLGMAFPLWGAVTHRIRSWASKRVAQVVKGKSPCLRTVFLSAEIRRFPQNSTLVTLEDSRF